MCDREGHGDLTGRKTWTWMISALRPCLGSECKMQNIPRPRPGHQPPGSTKRAQPHACHVLLMQANPNTRLGFARSTCQRLPTHAAPMHVPHAAHLLRTPFASRMCSTFVRSVRAPCVSVSGILLWAPLCVTRLSVCSGRGLRVESGLCGSGDPTALPRAVRWRPGEEAQHPLPVSTAAVAR